MTKRLDFSKRRKKWFLLLALFGASSYGAYKVYHSPTITRKRKRLVRVISALCSLVEIVSDSASTIGVVSKDLKDFLQSDSDKIPNSMNQISKLSQSNEFSQSLSKFFEALTVGVLRGYQSETLRGAGDGSEEEGGGSLADCAMDRVMWKAGTGFVSVVMGSFARNLVLGFYSSNDDGCQADEMSNLNKSAAILSSGDGLNGSNMKNNRWLEAICHDKSKELIANCIEVFVSTAVAVYLDKTMDMNIYDDLFAGLTNPKHEAKAKDMLVSVCNGAVETFVKTSHKVLTAKKAEGESSGYPPPECSEQGMYGDDMFVERERYMDKIQQQQHSSGWVNSVSSTLAVPSNRRFVIGMTGRVTFETLRSLVEFLIWKMSDGLRRSGNVVHDQIVGRGMEVVRYFCEKSSVIVTICLALYLHVMCGTRALVAA